MGSLAEARYCVQGERCIAYDPQTELPQKLSAYNKSTICERCTRASRKGEQILEAPSTEGSTPKDGVLSTRMDSQIRSLKRELVLKLYLQKGDFWEQVSAVRNKWDIEPLSQLLPGPVYATIVPPPTTARPAAAFGKGRIHALVRHVRALDKRLRAYRTDQHTLCLYRRQIPP